jgi:predicted Co/Zn/Cd cation transporter (cation efflux family)
MLQWLPEDVSTFGQEIDSLFYLIYYITAVTFIVVTVCLIILHKFSTNGKTYVLIVNYGNSLQVESEVMKTISKYRNKVRSKTMNREFTELTVELTLNTENMSITTKIMEIEGIHDVSLVQYRSSYDA